MQKKPSPNVAYIWKGVIHEMLLCTSGSVSFLRLLLGFLYIHLTYCASSTHFTPRPHVGANMMPWWRNHHSPPHGHRHYVFLLVGDKLPVKSGRDQPPKQLSGFADAFIYYILFYIICQHFFLKQRNTLLFMRLFHVYAVLLPLLLLLQCLALS